MLVQLLAVAISTLLTPVQQDVAALAQRTAAKDVAAIQRAVKANPSLARSRNANGISMLSLASQTDCVPCVRALVEAGADVKARDTDEIKRTPLHWAAGWSTVEVVRLLVELGAPLSARTAKGDTVLSFARENFFGDSTAERKKIVAYLTSRTRN